MSAARVNVKSCRRRLVAYSSLADLERDLDKLEAAHKQGTLKHLGNHQPGAICGHVAMGMRCAFDGYGIRAPWWIRWLGPIVKKGEISKPFKPGLTLPAASEKVAWDDSMKFEAALADLRAQVRRAGAAGAAPNQAHPFFGAMSPAEWQVYFLRHAELHMSFLQV